MLNKVEKQSGKQEMHAWAVWKRKQDQNQLEYIVKEKQNIETRAVCQSSAQCAAQRAWIGTLV